MSDIKVSLTAGAALDFAEVVADAMDHLDPAMLGRAQQAAQGESGEDTAELGAQIIKVMLRHSRHSAFRFLARVAGLTAEELEERPLTDVTEIIRQVKEDPELKDFLGQVQEMLN